MRRASLAVQFLATVLMAAFLWVQPTPAQTPVSVQVFPQNPTIYDNQMQQFDVFVTFSDGSTSGGSSITTGGIHSCAVLSTGAVMCWGYGGNGQLGNGTFNISSTPVQVTGLANATMVAAGDAHTCARRSDGTVWCWGYNGYGQLGNGSFSNSNLPVQVTGITNATAIAAGYYHSCARLADSTVKCWGRGSEGQLGNGSTSTSTTPQSVSGLSNVTQFEAGDYRTCARLGDGTLRCWGYGGNGELGNGMTSNSATPVQVSGIATATSVTVGGSFTCARLNDGTAKCWGHGGNGALGNGAFSSSSTPVQVSGISGASAIDAGYSHVCARLADASVQCWGYNGQGQLGNGTATTSNVPVNTNISNVTSVSAGANHTCSRMADSTLRCWGYNFYGQLGNGSSVNSTSPVMVVGITNAAAGSGAGSFLVSWSSSNNAAATVDQNGLATAVAAGTTTITADVAGVTGDTTLTVIPVPVLASISISPENPTIFDGQTQQFFASGTLSDGTPVTTESALAGGSLHSCVLRTSGTVSCWGYGSNGQLGNGSFGQSSVPVPVNNISNATNVAVGEHHSCARLADGTVWCWGYNGYGQLGDGTFNTTANPVQVNGINNAASIAAGAYHTCARLTDGTVKCWGRGYEGQWGNGATGASSTPVQVTGISTATQISADLHHTCARLMDGTLQCWGYNYYGQLGNGQINTQSNVPVTVTGINNAVFVSAGWVHTCARLADATVKCWGYNGEGQVGNGTFSSYSPTPSMVVGLTNVTALDTGYHSCARLSDGTVKCWGYNGLGQLGNGSFSSSAVPVAASGISNATGLGLGLHHSCSRLNDGTVKCWGYNQYGQVGNGTSGNNYTTPQDVSNINDASAGSGGSYLDGLVWSSSNTSVATIDANGLATGQSPGTTTIYATVGDVVGSTTLTVVTNAPIANDQSFSTPDNTPLNIHLGYTDPDGDSLAFSLTMSPLHGLLTGTAPDLVYTPLGDGAHDDSFAYQVCDVHGACDVATVSIRLLPTLASITVTPANPSILTGQTQQFMATGTFTDGSNFQPGGGAAVSGGIYHTCALLADGAVKCWGYNGNGQVGQPSFGSYYPTPTTVSGISNAVAVGTGFYHSCAVLVDGTAKCWGNGGNGQLGNGSFSASASPVTVSGLTNATTIAAGEYHTCALIADGSVKCWGNSGNGNLGHGVFDGNIATPVTVSGINNAVAIAAGWQQTCALLADGAMKCWGYGGYGQLGNGSFSSSAVPVSVTGITNATGVAAGYYTSCASLSDGSVKCWGYNSHGQLGSASSQSAIPVGVPGVSNATAVASGCHHTCALLGDGTLRCWGYNGQGGLGDGTFTSTSTPVTVSGLNTVTSIGQGYLHSCARLADGTLRCWGRGYERQLGDGSSSPVSTPVMVSGITNAAAGIGGSGLGNGLNGLVWSSSDTGVATINGSGLASGLTGGQTTITATVGSISGSTTLTVISPDSTPPVITPTVTGTLGNNGWYTSDVSVTWDVQDPETAFTTSGCGASSVTTDTTGVTFTCSATSTGGTASQSVTIKRDATAPTLNFGSPSPAPNGNGWNNTDVSIGHTASDNLSGVSMALAPSTTITGEGSNLTQQISVTDDAGNSATFDIPAVNIDRTAPAINGSRAPLANANGWNNTDVTVSFACSDALSGLAAGSPPADTTLSGEGAGQSVPGTCTDAAGNSASATVSNINIDKTAPSANGTASRAADSNGWYNHAFSVTWSGSDALSGIASCSAASNYGGPDTGSGSLAGSCSDMAGNSTNASFAFMYDATAPVITLTTPPSGAVYVLNDSVAASYSCADALSGMGNCTGTTANGANINTASVGGKTFTVNATDVAGNPATVTHNYSVQYTFVGFHQPVDNLPVINQVKPGRTIPVKWTLYDANGNVISDLGMFSSLLSAPIACDASPSAIVEEQLTSPGSTVLRFDATSNQFIFNWQSSSGWRGCRLLQLTLSDGTQHFAKFNFK